MGMSNISHDIGNDQGDLWSLKDRLEGVEDDTFELSGDPSGILNGRQLGPEGCLPLLASLRMHFLHAQII